MGYGGCGVIEWRMIARLWQFKDFIAAMLDGGRTCYGGLKRSKVGGDGEWWLP